MCRFEFIAAIILWRLVFAVEPDFRDLNLPLDSFWAKEFLHLAGSLTPEEIDKVKKHIYDEVPIEIVVGVFELMDPVYQSMSLKLFSLAGFTKTQYCFVEYVYEGDMILQLGYKCEPKFMKLNGTVQS